MKEVESLYFCVTHYFLGDMQDCRSIISVISAHKLSYVDNSNGFKHTILYNRTVALKRGPNCIYRTGSESEAQLNTHTRAQKN